MELHNSIENTLQLIVYPYVNNIRLSTYIYIYVYILNVWGTITYIIRAPFQYLMKRLIVKSRSCEIGSLKYRVALKFDRHIGSRGVWQFSERSNYTKYQSRGFIDFTRSHDTTPYRILKRALEDKKNVVCTHIMFIVIAVWLTGSCIMTARLPFPIIFTDHAADGNSPKSNILWPQNVLVNAYH